MGLPVTRSVTLFCNTPSDLGRIRAVVSLLVIALLAACGDGAINASTQATSSPPSSGGTTTPPPAPSPTNYTLQISLAGSGSVSSNPAGIACGADCSQSYASGASVTLTATPASGYNFSGWSGSGISCAGTGTCTVSMTASRSVVASFTSTNASGDLCDGLVTDRLAHPMTDVAKPALGGSFVDPQFGTTIRRITDAGARGYEYVKPMYSTISAWNADESLLLLLRAGYIHELYDGKTYQFIRTMDDIDPADGEQVYWHTSDPAILFYANRVTRQFIRYNVETRVKTVVRDFSTAPTSCSASEDLHGGSDPMYISWDANVIGLTCGHKIFTYNIATNTLGSVITLTTGSGGAQNAPQASANGDVFFLNEDDAIGTVRDKDMNVLRVLDLSNSGEHATQGRLANGHDAFFAVQFESGPVARSNRQDNSGTIVMHDMTDGSWRVLVGPSTGYPYPPSGTHLSAMAHKRPGWVAASVIGDLTNGRLGQTLLDSEIVLADAGSGRVCRVAHHRSCGGNCGSIGYFAEPHVVISPSGTRMIFGSDWNGGTTADTYVVELPSYRP